MTPSVHNPVRSVPLRTGAVDITELSWPDAQHLYRKLTGQMKDVMDGEGNLTISTGKVVAMITENVELGTWLVLKSTGKDEAWLNERSLSEVFDVATEAAVLNIGIIVERIKNAQGRLKGLMTPTQPAQKTD
jgi:hypothetical protein